jgi:integrase
MKPAETLTYYKRKMVLTLGSTSKFPALVAVPSGVVTVIFLVFHPSRRNLPLLNGERTRDFVLSRGLEEQYIANAPQPLADIALLIFETGLRIGEVLQLRWEHVRLNVLSGAR